MRARTAAILWAAGALAARLAGVPAMVTTLAAAVAVYWTAYAADIPRAILGTHGNAFLSPHQRARTSAVAAVAFGGLSFTIHALLYLLRSFDTITLLPLLGVCLLALTATRYATTFRANSAQRRPHAAFLDSLPHAARGTYERGVTGVWMFSAALGAGSAFHFEPVLLLLAALALLRAKLPLQRAFSRREDLLRQAALHSGGARGHVFVAAALAGIALLLQVPFSDARPSDRLVIALSAAPALVGGVVYLTRASGILALVASLLSHASVAGLVVAGHATPFQRFTDQVFAGFDDAGPPRLQLLLLGLFAAAALVQAAQFRLDATKTARDTTRAARWMRGLLVLYLALATSAIAGLYAILQGGLRAALGDAAPLLAAVAFSAFGLALGAGIVADYRRERAALGR